MRHQDAVREEWQAPWRKGLAGFTLLELMVVLALMSVTLGVTGLAFTTLHVPPVSGRVRALARARTEAIRTGRPVRSVIRTPPAVPVVIPPAPLFLPDGRALGPGVDPLTGAPIDSAP